MFLNQNTKENSPSYKFIHFSFRIEKSKEKIIFYPFSCSLASSTALRTARIAQKKKDLKKTFEKMESF